MDYIIIVIVAFIAGVCSGFFLWEPKRLGLEKRKRVQNAEAQQLEKLRQANNTRAQDLGKRAADLQLAHNGLEEHRAKLTAEVESAWVEVRKEKSRLATEAERFQSRFISMQRAHFLLSLLKEGID